MIYFLIQRIKVVRNQLRNSGRFLAVDQCYVQFSTLGQLGQVRSPGQGKMPSRKVTLSLPTPHCGLPAERSRLGVNFTPPLVISRTKGRRVTRGGK